jgi:hypothetical protein
LIATINTFNFRWTNICGRVLEIAFADDRRTETSMEMRRDEYREWNYGEDRAPISIFSELKTSA